MSVIVRGMGMPKNCFSCACASYYERLDKAMCDLTNKQLDQKVWKKERHPNCPLVEVNETLFSADNAREFLRENPPKEGGEA